MPLVTVTYNVWDVNRQVIPAEQDPQIWFRPIWASYAAGLMTDREVRGTLTTATGVGQVQLESTPDLFYVPILRWSPLGADADLESIGKAYTEWPIFHPGKGGPIDTLTGSIAPLSALWYGFGKPPAQVKEQDRAIYLDITGPDIGIWVPDNIVFKEGTVI